MAKPKVLDPVAAKKRKEKIIIITAIAALVVLIGGGIGGCFACRGIQAKNLENKVKKIVEESQSEGKSLAEKLEQTQELKNLEDLTDDVNDLKEKIQTDSDTISELNTSGSKNQVIKDKTVGYLEKYETYLVSLKGTIEQYSKEETTSTEGNQTTATTSTTATKEESETEEIAAGEETKDLQEKGDELKTAYEDLKKEASEIISADFEQKITNIPLMVQALIEGKKISDLLKEQEEAAKKAAEEAAKQSELEKQRAESLQKAQSTMTQFENALKSNDLNGFYNTTTSEFQSSADGQAIATAIQGAGTGLKSYIIKSNSRVTDQKYRFVVRETYEIGGNQTAETKTYEVIKSGTRWLVDDIL